MRRIILILTVLCGFMTSKSFAQIATCDSDIEVGQNLIVNGGFEDGDTGFNAPGYLSWNNGEGEKQFIGPDDYYSSKGEYYVIDDSYLFNKVFVGRPRTGNNMLAVDGLCDAGNVVWEQEVTIEENTRYYFSVWISSIHQDSTARLTFEIAGELLPEQIIAPKGVENLGKWVNFVDSSWYSGTNSGPVMIRIRNSQNSGCDDGNDFALDDISFSPGCFFGGPGQIPDFGADEFTLCGLPTGELTLTAAQDPGVNYEYRWSSNAGAGTTNEATFTEPGFYGLCMTTNGSCARFKGVTITDDFSVSLGPDVDLCSPATTTLAVDYTLGQSYDWYKDGETEALGQFRNQTQATVNEVGTYRVVVTDPNASCGTREDEVIVTSSTIQAVNAFFCPDDGSVVDLMINNMVNDPSNYVWYSDEALTNQVAVGGSYTTPNGLTQTTTYWVKDESTVSFTAGVPSNGTYFSSGYGESSADSYIEFEVKNDLIIDTVSLYLAWAGWGAGQTVGLRIMEWDNGFVSEPFNQTLSFPAACADGSCNNASPEPVDRIEFPVGIALEKGKTYRMTRVAGAQTFTYDQTFDFNDLNNEPNYIEIVGTQQSNKLPGFFDWKIRSGAVCDPVQVQAVYDPIRCIDCEAPSSVAINVTGTQPLICSSDEVTLTADVTDGLGTWDYVWTKDGQPFGANATSITVNKADAGSFELTVQDQTFPDICTASSALEQITTDNPLEPSVSLNADLSQTQCLLGGVQATATALNVTNPVYSWTVSGDASQSQDLNDLALNVVDGDVVIVSVDGQDDCGDNVSVNAQVTVAGEEEITPTAIINGADGLCDNETAALTATITPSTLTNVTYAWTITPGGATSSDPQFDVDLNDGDQIDLVLTFGGGECLTSTTANAAATADVTASGEPFVDMVATNNGLCAFDRPMNFQVAGNGTAGTNPTYEWFVDGESAGTGETFSSDVIEDGQVVTVVMTSSAQCATLPTATSDAVTASVIAAVDAEVTVDGNATICTGQDVTATATVLPQGTAGDYQWFVDGNPVGTNQDSYTAALVDGNVVTVEFTVTDPCPVNAVEASTNSLTVVESNPTVSITSIFSGDLCSGKDNGYEVSSSTLGGGAPLFEWTLNDDPTVLSTESKFVSSSFATGDEVKLRMIPNPANGCPDATTSAVLGEFANQETIGITIRDSVLCEGDQLELTVSTSGGGSLPKFQWYRNDTELVDDTLSTLTVSAAEADEYKVQMISSLYCVDDTITADSITLHVVTVPVADAGPDVQLEDYVQVEIDGSNSTSGDVSYLWEASNPFLHESMIGRQTDKVTVTPIDETTYFTLEVSRTSEGVTCKDSDFMVLTIDFDFEVPNAFSPNGDGTNDFFVIDNLDKLDDFNIQIYNRWGVLLYEQENATEYWDGTNGGDPVPASTYFYIFNYELNGEKSVEDGYISLIR